MVIRYKDTPWKRIDDGQTEGRTPRIDRPPTPKVELSELIFKKCARKN